MDRIVEVAGVGQLFPVTAVIQIKGGGSWKEKARQQKLIKILDEIRTWPEVAKVQSADLFVKLSVNLFGLRLGLGFGDGFSGRFLSKNLDHVSMDILAKKVDDLTFDRLVKRLRDRLPEMLADDPALVGWVGGNPSVAWETKTHLTASLPTMIPIVIVVAFLLMALFFRSLVIPTKAVLLNVLSLATTFGILVLVFQHGWGIWILGVQGPIPGALSIITPVVLFCVLFGVSMDYEVFLVARIQEAYQRFVADGATDAEARVQAHRTAIHEGLSRTGGIITNAALVMVLTFAAFLSGSLLPMKEIGFALALAVLIDATLVRMMLVPAILTLVGPATWFWPLRRKSRQ
jgi:RND superfamily putative drug exporter